jgi:hypothetical protein
LKFKLFIFSALFIISCNSKKLDTCFPDSLSEHIVAFYGFQNKSLNDISGNNNHLLNINSVEFGEDRDGNPNCAARFSNEPDQFLTTSGSFLDDLPDRAFSVSLWYYAEGVESDFELLLGRARHDTFLLSCPDKYGEWSVALYDCRRAVGSVHKKAIWEEKHAIWDDTTTLNINRCKFESDFYSDKWKHIVFTYRNDCRRIYIDGVMQETLQAIGTCGRHSENLGDLYIGHFFTGRIDDVVILDKEVSQDEVTQLFHFTPCCKM